MFVYIRGIVSKDNIFINNEHTQEILSFSLYASTLQLSSHSSCCSCINKISKSILIFTHASPHAPILFAPEESSLPRLFSVLVYIVILFLHVCLSVSLSLCLSFHLNMSVQHTLLGHPLFPTPTPTPPPIPHTHTAYSPCIIFPRKLHFQHSQIPIMKRERHAITFLKSHY